MLCDSTTPRNPGAFLSLRPPFGISQVSGGPSIPFRPGRKDAVTVEESVEDGRLPDATQSTNHLRDVFGRMGMTDEEIVALSGAHTLGRAHLDRSGFDGPWTENPLEFDNSYFKNLLERKWTVKANSVGNIQFEVCLPGGILRGVTNRDALEGKGPQRGAQQRLGRRLEEVAEAVGGGYCRLQTFDLRET